MPATYEQLKRMHAEHNDRFLRERRELMQFSQALFRASATLSHSEDDNDLRNAKKLEQYSTALENVMQDPTDPKSRAEIDRALDTLSTLGDFLGGASNPEYGAPSVCGKISLQDDASEYDGIEKGLKSFNNSLGFALNGSFPCLYYLPNSRRSMARRPPDAGRRSVSTASSGASGACRATLYPLK